MRSLATFDGIVDALGGVDATAELCDCTRANIFNWRHRGFFPTVQWFVILEGLEEKGYTTTARWLFRFRQRGVSRRRAAA